MYVRDMNTPFDSFWLGVVMLMFWCFVFFLSFALCVTAAHLANQLISGPYYFGLVVGSLLACGSTLAGYFQPQP